jgi:aryl-alcohol dehydrogenase-like predicted oxidoreductase
MKRYAVQYARLDQTGLTISRIALGCMAPYWF